MNVGPQVNARAPGIRWSRSPYTRSNRRYSFRQNYNRRYPIMRYRRRYISSVPRSLNLPNISTEGNLVSADAQNVILQYNGTFTLSLTASGTATHLLSSNGMYDPDITSTGGQPNGYDIYSALYERYKVNASSCTLRYRHGANSELAVIVLTPAQVNAGVSYAEDLGNPYAKSKVVPTFEGGFIGKLTNYISMTKLFGVTNPGTFSDEAYGAAVGANPINLGYWGVKAATYNNAVPAQTSTVEVMFQITYYATFYQRKSVPRS